jgi:hypothetical protein
MRASNRPIEEAISAVLGSAERPASSTAWLLVATFVYLSSMVGCVLPVGAQTAGNTSLDYQVHKPVSLIDLLRNAKVAIDNALPLNEDFYTEGSLSRFFGGTTIVGDWPVPQWRDPRYLQIEIADFGICPPWIVGADGRPIEGLSILIKRDLRRQEDAWADLQLTIRDACGPPFEEVEALFGTRWKIEERPLPEPHAIPQTTQYPTAPHGGDLISYDYFSHGLERRLIFSFRYDGRIESARFSVKR